MGKIRDRSKVHDHRKSKLVSDRDRKIDGMIIDATLSPLHPIDDALAIRVG
jgi:hypothetical protein